MYSDITAMSDKTVINITKVHSNGRVQIPIEIRKELKLSDGDKVYWFQDSQDRVFIEKLGAERKKGRYTAPDLR